MTVLSWIGAGLVVVTMVGVLAGKCIALNNRPTPEFEPSPPSIEAELTAVWREIRALDCTYDALSVWENDLLDERNQAGDEFVREAAARLARRVEAARQVVTELRDRKAVA